jgi:subtilase family serine protease
MIESLRESGGKLILPETAEGPVILGPGPTDIRRDLAAFDSKFGLRAAKLNVVNTIARAATPYLAASEEVEDTEMVHAIAPGATLDVVLVPPAANTSVTAFAAAITQVGAIHLA